MTEFVIMGLLPDVAEDLHVTIPQAGQLIAHACVTWKLRRFGTHSCNI